MATLAEMKESIRMLKHANYWIGKMDDTDREFVAAALLHTTQDTLRWYGLSVSQKVASTNG